ncbi:hypothetical protein [uncultured Bacteroides sp.]|uniref:tetratricopeptide repeat protein n=1 Tax=uncultured Bacteroides sp. TaxID=162156 RepID=UPI0025DB1FD1|nr:hypothetical protein [uncultured Bacteroides sp.]
MKTIFLFILFIFCASCVNNSWFTREINIVETLIEHYPDSAFSILNGLELPYNLSKRDNALYCLLLVKAMDKTYRQLDTDSIINIAFNYFKESNDSSLIAQSYFYKGRVLQEMQNEELAIEHFLKGIDFCTANDSRLMFLTQYYLGNLYSDQELFEEELAMQKKAYSSSLLLGDSLSISFSICAIGNAQNHLDINDEALLSYKKALLWVAANDSSMQAYIYNSIGSIYNKVGDYKQAIYYAQLSENNQSDEDELLYLYTLKGHIYMNMHQCDSSRYYYIKSKESSDLYTKAASYRGLYNIERTLGDYKKSIFYNEQYLLYRDSIEKKLHTDAVVKMQNIYQYEKMEDKNHLLQIAKIQAESNLYKLYIFSISFLVLLVILYSSFKIKKERKIHQQESIIAENMNQLQLCEMEQMKKEREIMKHKQEELMLREDFYKKMVSYSVPNLNKHQCDERIKLSELDWDKIINNVDIAFNGFSKRLCREYPKLTSDDVRLCALLKMNLSVSELALIYCVEKVSIYKKKERIKKVKMNIHDSSLNLDNIIHDF